MAYLPRTHVSVGIPSWSAILRWGLLPPLLDPYRAGGGVRKQQWGRGSRWRIIFICHRGTAVTVIHTVILTVQL